MICQPADLSSLTQSTYFATKLQKIYRKETILNKKVIFRSYISTFLYYFIAKQNVFRPTAI